MKPMTPIQVRAWYAIGWSLFGLNLALIAAACIWAAVANNPIVLLPGLLGVWGAISCYTQLKGGPR